MAKALKDILAGVKISKTEKLDLKNLQMSPNKDNADFIAKHEVEKHADRVGNDCDTYKGKTSKTSKYKFQKDGVYEAASCNHTNEGVMCEVHGEAACPTESTCPSDSGKDKKEKSKKLLLDKKKVMDEASQYRSTFGMGAKRGWASAKAGKITFQDPHPLPKSGPKKAELRASAEKAMASGNITKLPPGKAKGLKEEDINEVAPPNPKIENWIKANKERFVKEYGKEKGMQNLYAKAWKMHGQSESGPATNTDYAGPGAAGWSTGRLDVGTL
jgi:hypothetical protein